MAAEAMNGWLFTLQVVWSFWYGLSFITSDLDHEGEIGVLLPRKRHILYLTGKSVRLAGDVLRTVQNEFWARLICHSINTLLW